jgi:uncharacterized membrane protein SpoIIM required for sporulation
VTPLEFEESNQASWSEFEILLSKTDQGLDAERFLRLYRTCCEQLAMAQARGFPAHVIERLSVMTALGHQIIYRQSDFGLLRLRKVLLEEFPQRVRMHRRYVLIAAAIFLVPTVALGFATYVHPDLILSVVDAQTAEAFQHMYAPTAEAIGRTRNADSNWQMFGFYIMNNIGIAFQCYVTGILFGLGSLFFLAYNGAFGGAVGGYVASLGYGGTFFPFIATHSAFELTAIVLCGAAGLRLGHAVLLPGRLPRLLSMQTAARDTSLIVFGSAVMLVIAATIEAFWSSAAWVSAAAKYAFAAGCWLLVGLFFLRRSRAR